MSRAILVAGNELRFLERINLLEVYLQTEVGVSDIVKISAGYMNAWDLGCEIERHLARNSSEPLFFAYVGHGNERGWGPNGFQELDSQGLLAYNFLIACLLKKYNGPLLFYNDCCYAMHAVEAIEHHECDPQKFSFIGTLIDAGVSDGSIDEMVRCLRSCRSYIPQPINVPTEVSVDEAESSSKTWWQIGFKNLLRRYEKMLPRDYGLKLDNLEIKLSELLNKLFPKIFTDVYLGTIRDSISLVVVEREETGKLVEKIIPKAPAFNENYKRWGKELDHLFFPRQFQSSK